MRQTNLIESKEQGLGEAGVMRVPAWAKRCAVDCKDVYEFAYKYRKPDRFVLRGKKYVDSVMKTHNDDLEKRGYTCISRHDNVTGEIIFYIKSARRNHEI